MSIASMIESIPGVCGGRARIAGTRVPVHRIARYYRLGYSPEEMLPLLNSLTLAQIHAALAYYHANRDEIDTDIAADDAVVEQIFPAQA